MEFVDTHCHPFFEKFANPEAVIADAASVGVNRLICVGTTLQDSQKAIKLASEHKNCWASVGAHPHDAKTFDFQGRFLEMGKMLSNSKVVAVGEIGLDYYKDYSPRDIQKKVFEVQIKAGLNSGLPFIFHVRDAQHQDESGAGQAWEEFFKIIDAYQGIKGVVHSFSAHEAQLEQILKRGLYVGLNGIMTFTNDVQQLKAAKKVPKDRLLLETDAPFLAPKAFRGKTCEPKHLIATAEFLAKLRSESLEELADYTTKNAMELFKLV